jgi:peroxiredoxin (alkyl hydroperoxide reductase subunit C)
VICERIDIQEVGMPELKDGCVKPAGGPILPEPDIPVAGMAPSQEASRMLARVGKEAIDFEASAFVAGEGFKPVKLSDYRGQWIVLCFYPGDFTFV